MFYNAGVLPIRYRTPSGRPLISVTQVLTVRNRINAEWFTPESAWRGSTVHLLTQAFDQNLPLNVPAGLEGYLDAYAEFRAVVRPRYAFTELSVRDERLDLGGRIDRVCDDLFGAPGLLDFKTGDQYSWHALQLAGYNLLRPTGNRWGCYLQPNGKYKLKLYDDPQDHRKFAYDLAQACGTVTADGDYWIQAA